jgi:hypothetical protein
MNLFEEDDSALFKHYVEIGAIDFVGVEKNGEAIYKVNEIAKDIAPELWKAHTEYIDDAMLKLFESGFLDVSYDENLEATFSLSQEGEEMAKELGLVEMNKEEE